MILFWLFWATNALVALIAVYFFIIGLADGSVSGDNFLLWVLLLAGLAGFLVCSLWLRKLRHTGWASVLLSVPALPALPALGYGIILLVAVMSGTRWN